MKHMIAKSVATVALASLVSGCFEPPPAISTQTGFRGLSMGEVLHPATVKAKKERDAQYPPAQPAVKAEGPPVSKVYKNVKVLGDLTEPEFLRTMTAMTEWVAPKEGCTYCHDEADLASDAKYTYQVSRRMLEMTRHINTDWSSHVAQTGVTCYTCHRGRPVPPYIRYLEPRLPLDNAVKPTFVEADNSGQIVRLAKNTAYSALNYDPFAMYLANDKREIRFVPQTALPPVGVSRGMERRSMADAYSTFALMMFISDAIGTNCTFCHNPQTFESWGKKSTPQRAIAWHGIRLVRDLNMNFLTPLKPVYPANRLGAQGEAPMADCRTCHQGVTKPLFGASRMKDYPELGPVKAAAK
ncbi:photosynthetic reaction center cytochrome PufC [Blastochloris sulfoviridis]|uniref:Photosynthetic reaction center cytochrome c subunit n=1 Tax=Blastochloris sulfoviridis TaxID=50712 RepID=A0A5M6I5F7_9HYPH|nr:photosynthetic reaction center cytochrome PufC [Blastochloris sulfoviridis]KAA5603039.1 photosynthetic reaction center cytochrome c subunit [Blastochloris sulfoviridis]NJL08433.1 photosynthetic reaction center cytochrome c subunit [Candidatus Methylacidiphilales bacterium]